MSKIDEQIKILQRKKKKIDYISYVADLIKNDTKCIDFKDVKKEVVESVEPFLLTLIDSVEKDLIVSSSSQKMFSDEEVDILKLVALAAKKKKDLPAQVLNQNSGAFNSTSPETTKRSELSTGDKMQFAMSNRGLANKRVQVINDKNVQIFGIVVGLDAPHVVVKTETGPTINVPLEKVVLV